MGPMKYDSYDSLTYSDKKTESISKAL